MIKDISNAFTPDGNFIVQPNRSGQLSGLTFAAKELIAVKSKVTGCGNPHWLQQHKPANQTAPCIERLMNAGATMTGHTISDELAFSLDGENVHYGTPLNPKAPSRIPGGSSAGSASAVAAETVGFALGTDTAGSVRIPAAYCGIYGFRPTHGAISTEGVHPMACSFDVVGAFAREQRLLNQVVSVMLDDQKPQNTVKRVLVMNEWFESLGQSEAGRYQKAISRLGAKDFELVKVELPWLDTAQWIETLRNIQWYELNAAHGIWLKENIDTVGEEIRGRLRNIHTVTDADYQNHCQLREQFRQQINDYLSGGDILVMPTAPSPAPLKGRDFEQARAFRMKLMKHVCVATVAGLPQLSVPLTDAGLPLGLSFIAGSGQDSTLLSIGLNDCC